MYIVYNDLHKIIHATQVMVCIKGIINGKSWPTVHYNKEYRNDQHIRNYYRIADGLNYKIKPSKMHSLKEKSSCAFTSHGHVRTFQHVATFQHARWNNSLSNGIQIHIINTHF